MELQLVQHDAAADGRLTQFNSVLIGNDADDDDDSAVQLAARLGRARWVNVFSG
jgi:hypothetical protein